MGPSTSLSSSSVSAFCEVVFVVERSPGFLPFPCLASRIGRGFDLGSREVIDFFYRFVHGGPMAVWLSSFCDSVSATSSRMVGLSSMAFSNFWFGGCSLFVVVSYLLCPGSLPSGQDVDLKRQCVICLSFGDGDLFLLCSSMCMSCQWCDQVELCCSLFQVLVFVMVGASSQPVLFE